MQFNVNLLPTGNRAIATVEELITWATLALGSGTNTTYIPRQNAEAEKIAGVQIGNDFNKVLRAQSLIAPPVTNGWDGSGGTPLWKNVAEVSTLVLPEDYSN